MQTRVRGGSLILISALLAAGCGGGPEKHALHFQDGDPDSDLAPRFHPKGTTVVLEPAPDGALEGHDALLGTMRLGPGVGEEVLRRLALGRSSKGGPYDRLQADLNGDDALAGEPVVEAEVNAARGKTWSSFRGITLAVRHDEEGEDLLRAYRVNCWLAVEDTAIPPEELWCAGTGYWTASLKIGRVPHLVFLSDGDNDGVFGEGDSWTVVAGENLAEPYNIKTRRDVGDFAWALGRAWMLELEGTSGRRGTLVSHDPGITPEEDEVRRDTYRADRLAAKAKEPIVFRADADEAIAQARKEGKPYFVKFEAEWCGSCLQMDKLVYTAESVARAAEGVVCIKVDGDERKDLCERFGAEIFPAGVLFDGTGEEVARFRGYRSVRQMTAFFEKAKR